MTTPTRDQVQPAPKVLLHDHLDGGLRPADRHRAGRARSATRAARPRDAERARALVPARADSRVAGRSTWRRSPTPSASCRPREALVRVAARVRRGPRRRRRRLRRGALRAGAAPRGRADPRRGRRGRAGGLPRRAWPPDGRPIRIGTLLTAMRHAARSLRDRRAGRALTATRASSASTSPAPRRASRPPATSTPFQYIQRENVPLHDPRRRGVRAAVDLGGAAVVRRRPARPRRADRRRHQASTTDGTRRARAPGGVRPRPAHPARDVPDVATSTPARRRRSPSTRSACCAGCASGSRSTPTTG